MSNFVKGTAHYAFLKRTSPVNQKYCMDLINLDEDSVAKLEAEGVSVKDSEEKGRWIGLTSQYPAVVKDSKGNELPDSVVNTIGNGSLVSVPIKTYNTQYKKETFTKVTLGTVFVEKLVKYEVLPETEEDAFVYTPSEESEDTLNDDEIPF